MTRDEIISEMTSSGFDGKSLGEKAYVACAETKGWKSFKGEPLQQFSEMK